MKTRPRVVHVAPYYPPHLGGMEVVAKSIAEGLAASHEVEVLTSDRGAALPRIERHRNLTVRRLRALELAHTPLMPSLLWHLLRQPRNTVVHLHAGVAFCPEIVWFATKIRRANYVLHFHLDVDAVGSMGFLLPWYKRFVLGPILRRAYRVVTVSPDQPEVLVQNFGVPAGRIQTIPNGIDDSFSTVERQPPSAARPFRWLFVGRLSPHKNVGLLIEAMAKMGQSAELVIVGDGDERDRLEQLAQRLGLTRVTFAGAQRGDDLLAHYQQADAFVLPSRKESTGLVLLEAMSAGLPVVATNVEGVRETVGTDGILVEETSAALAAAMDRVTADPGLWAELAARSAGRSGQHSWDGPIDQFRALYAEAAAS